MLSVLGLILFLVVIFVFGVILNGGMYFIADKLGWFKPKEVKNTWFDKLVYKAIIRYYGRKW